jgi:hypothetical protein
MDHEANLYIIKELNAEPIMESIENNFLWDFYVIITQLSGTTIFVSPFKSPIPNSP